MNSPDELRQENAALRERISMLNAAILRISASLDLDTVLREVVDGARALTGARYGIIATVDDTGTIREFVASGLSADERRHMAEWPHGYQFFEHLQTLPGALRLADVPAYVRSLGYSEELTLSKTLQATPMRHRGVHVGNFFLGEKAGGQEFTGEDEEVLVLFASQAATAIANARTHRDEQRARADLEALVDTSPVGVVVFDANSGRPVSFKRWHQHLVDVGQEGGPMHGTIEHHGSGHSVQPQGADEGGGLPVPVASSQACSSAAASTDSARKMLPCPTRGRRTAVICFPAARSCSRPGMLPGRADAGRVGDRRRRCGSTAWRAWAATA